MKIEFSKLVDLSHTLNENNPIWEGDPETEISRVENKKYVVERICVGTHTGTHVGSPAHFYKGFEVYDLKPNDLLSPAVVVDVSSKHEDHVLSVEEIKEWEFVNGGVEKEAMLLKTGWGKFWNEPQKYFSKYPGFGVNAVKYLINKGVRIFGTDAPGIEPSNDENFSVNEEIFRNGCIHIENLTNLDKLPNRGFWIFVGVLKIKAGGSPARVVAMV